MVKHIILWKLSEALEGSKKEEVRIGIKKNLEGLYGKIPGLVSMKININPLSSSNVDVMMDSTFEDENALKGYQKHPEHVKVADTFVRPYTVARSCMDYEI
ncbi:MAG: Dabb family protein [Clostridium sp.]|nr:Dabb family protein [Clostridium sp.]MCM1173128.1 Dabb family protein [Clostridium sp.]